MAVEYLYWGVAAWTGALVGRGEEIKREWKFETRAKLEAGDLKMTAIIKVGAGVIIRAGHLGLVSKDS